MYKSAKITIASVAATIGLVVASLLAVPQAAMAAKIDISKAEEIGLLPCETASELDCLESFGFIDSSGKYVPGKVTNSFRGQPVIGANGNTVTNAQSSWKADVDGKSKTATINIPLQSPNYIIFKAPDGNVHYGASLRPWVDGADLLNTKVRFVVRTSYLKPQNVQLVADEADFKQTVIPGGNSWMFEGKGTQVSFYTEDVQKKSQDWSAKADMDSTTLHFIIHHADSDLSKGYWPASCASKGYSVQAFNSNSAGEPRWNAASQTLEFSVPAPHLMASGQPQVGFFKLWTTDAYMNCQWKGNNLASANGISVSIVDQDGSTQTATSQVVHANGRLYVEATGFHYSSPKIKLKAISAKSSITCVSLKNAKVSKTVSGAAPKCPSGFKKK